MPKLMLTTFCNQDCSYCFVKNSRQSRTSSCGLSLDLLEQFLRLSQRDPVVLSGGEPVLHSKFAEILTRITQEGRSVALLTNGSYEPERLRSVSLKGLKWVLLNALSEPLTLSKQDNIRKNIATLLNNHVHVTLGCTLYCDFMNLDFMYALLDEYALRAVRLSLVNPSMRNSLYLSMESHIRTLSPLYQSVVTHLNMKDVMPTIDCGVPPCIVPQDRYLEFRRRSFWSEGCATDLNLFPDGYLYHCHCSFDDAYPLEKIEEAKLIARNKEDALRWGVPSMQECVDCEHWKSRSCQGGCLGWKLRRMRDEST